MEYSKSIFRLDCEFETKEICSFIRDQVKALKRKGIVLGLSGGVDSALCSVLCAKALGEGNVLALVLPEKDSSDESKKFALDLAEKFNLSTEVLDITDVLSHIGTYSKRDCIIKKIFPEYNASFTYKIFLPPDLLHNDSLNYYKIAIISRNGEVYSKRLNQSQLSTLVASTNTKQRVRMIYLYYYAEKMNYLVCGTTNRTETKLGYFVKYGDGGVDIEPVAHLYKTQIYELADYLGVIEEIIERAPSPDTYSACVSDEDFYFRMPYSSLDLLLYAWENKIEIAKVCDVLGLDKNQVERVYNDFDAKKKASEHLRQIPTSMQNNCQ